MKKNDIKAAALAFCTVMAFCGCSQKSGSESTTGTSSSITGVERSTEKSSSSSAVSSSVSTTSSSESASSSESSNICYSRVKPILGYKKAKLYHINDKVNVVAKTNTDYYKLDNGEFISVDYLSANKITVQSSSSSASSSKISSSSSSSSRHSDIVYIDISSSIGRPLSDYFD